MASHSGACRMESDGLLHSNVDGRFNSQDLVQIFQASQYEDAIPGNSNWSTGDWNCDGDFTSRDLVAAFQAATYSAAARADVDPAGAIESSKDVNAVVFAERETAGAMETEGDQPAPCVTLAASEIDSLFAAKPESNAGHYAWKSDAWKSDDWGSDNPSEW